MYQLFFEDPAWLVGIGLGVVGVATFFWLQLRSRATGFATIGLTILFTLLVVLNIQVMTTRERLESILDELTSALGDNDHDTVIAYLHPNAQPSVVQAKNLMLYNELTYARINRIKDIAVNLETTPPTAVIQFNATVGLDYGGRVMDIRRFVKLYMMEREGKWLVRDLEHFEPTAGFRE